jgi:hypothetical protein
MGESWDADAESPVRLWEDGPQEGFVGKYQGTHLDGLSAGGTIRVNGYFPCLTELYRAYYCSLSTFHHGRSINLAAANTETVEIRVCPILYLNVY